MSLMILQLHHHTSSVAQTSASFSVVVVLQMSAVSELQLLLLHRIYLRICYLLQGHSARQRFLWLLHNKSQLKCVRVKQLQRGLLLALALAGAGSGSDRSAGERTGNSSNGQMFHSMMET